MVRAGRKRGGRQAEGRARQGPLTVFVHIPKTAGTTFAGVLRDNFPDGVRNLGNVFKGSGGFDPGPGRRLRDAPELRTRDVQVLTGHLPFGIRDRLSPDTRYITFLRDPIERTLSQYYGLLKLNRRRPLPGNGSFEAVLADGEIIYDNLQTRMLCDSDEPVGDVDERMLEQAKENLRSGFTAFGLAERFDESLVLFKRLLGLRTVIYIQQRVATRPRGSEVPEETIRLAETFNRYDIELYRWARETFEQIVADDEVDFAADVAALAAARGGAVPPPPEAVDPGELWEHLVRTRSELFVDHRDLARAEVAGRSETAALLGLLYNKLSDLSRLTVAASPVESEPEADPAPETPVAPPRAEGSKRRERSGGGAGKRARAATGGKKQRSTEGAKKRGTAEEGGKRRARAAEGGKTRQRPAERGTRRARLDTRAAQAKELHDEAVARLEVVQQRLEALEGQGDSTAGAESAELRQEAANLEQRVERLSGRSAQIRDRFGALPSEDAETGA